MAGLFFHPNTRPGGGGGGGLMHFGTPREGLFWIVRGFSPYDESIEPSKRGRKTDSLLRDVEAWGGGEEVYC